MTQAAPKAATLRTYADIFAMSRRECVGGRLIPPTEPCVDAALCLRIVADAIDRNDIYLPAEWRT